MFFANAVWVVVTMMLKDQQEKNPPRENIHEVILKIRDEIMQRTATLSAADLGSISWSYGVYGKETHTSKEFTHLFIELSTNIISKARTLHAL